MKKISLLVMIALAFALVTNLTIAQASTNPDPDGGHVGYVVAYTPNESITIVDKDGSQFTFTLVPDLKIVPKHRANLLNVGSFVTVISPSSVNKSVTGNRIATGLVIHPRAPNGFPIPTFTFTPLPTDTALPSATPTEVPTETAVVTETPTFTETPTATTTVTETETATATATGTMTETPTATPTETATGGATTTTSTQVNTPSAVTSFMDWLASLFRQFLASNG